MAKSIALKRAYLLTAFIAMTFSQIGCDTQLTDSTGNNSQPWPEQPTPWHAALTSWRFKNCAKKTKR